MTTSTDPSTGGCYGLGLKHLMNIGYCPVASDPPAQGSIHFGEWIKHLLICVIKTILFHFMCVCSHFLYVQDSKGHFISQRQ